jgi:adenylate cyclase
MEEIKQAVKKINENATQIVALLLECRDENHKSLTQDDKLHLDKILGHAKKVQIHDIYAEDLSESAIKKLRHDLRNHINAIIGYSEIVMEDHLGSDAGGVAQCSEKIVTLAKKILLAADALQIEGKPESNQSIVSVDVESVTDVTDLDEFKKSFSVLIVDDIQENTQLLEKLLKRNHYANIYLANDAFQAKAMLSEHKVDLMLLDIDMPVKSGIDLLEEIKESISTLQLMVIMVTGSDAIENAIQCIKLGAEDFLTKPVDAEMLRVRLDSSLRKKWFLVKQKEYAEYIEAERKRYADLLSAIFPPKIVTELSQTGQVKARSYENVAMLFTDIVGFTHYCDTHPLDETMQGIQDFSAICEAAAAKYNLQKIKTIGDGFLAVAGMLTEHENPVYDCVQAAIEILQNTKAAANGWQVRAGIDCGTIIGGVVGHRQYLFDVWGDSVNTAARTLNHAEPDSICLTERAYKTVNSLFLCKSLGVITLKGKDKPIELFQFVK